VPTPFPAAPLDARSGSAGGRYGTPASKSVWAIEVKSGRPGHPQGLAALTRSYPQAKPFVVGRGGMPLEEFFLTDPATLFS